MYMKSPKTVGIAELRQNLSRHLVRVRAGERLVVTDRNRPVAMLGPPPGAGSDYEQLLASGTLLPPEDPGPIAAPTIRLAEPYAASRALERARDGER